MKTNSIWIYTFLLNDVILIVDKEKSMDMRDYKYFIGMKGK